MSNEITEHDAQLALSSIDLRRRQVIAEIDLPWWYWWGVAVAWVALGLLSDGGNAWLIGSAMLMFGAAHAAVAHHALSGRHRTSQLSVRADTVSRHLPLLVVGYLVLLVGVTIGLAIAVDADGARHPSTIASVVVAVAVLCGGPRLLAAVRRHAEVHAAP